MDTQIIGEQGENIAIEHLKKHEYKVLEHNWRHKHLEIDIIAQKGKELIIVEVKTRSGNYLQEPYLSVNKQKQRLLIEGANRYIEQKKLDTEVRFDIISVILTPKGPRVEHIENAFYPTVR